MKTVFKTIAAIFVISILSAGTTVIAEEKTKEYYESWSVSSVQALEISNKFGEVRVSSDRTDSVTISVTVTVEARDEKRADDLLDKIEVEFKKSGSTAKALTTIQNNFKSQSKFSIDYVVSVPSDKNLNIANKYGNTVVNVLSGEGDFDIQYGNFSANSLIGEMTKINLSYGNANIEEAGNLNAYVKYSPISMGEVKNVELTSKYSDIEIEEVKTIQIESKYDKLRFQEVESLSASTKYSHIRISELKNNLKVESGYGSIKVAEVASDFEFIDITNSYGKISLGLDENNYAVDASCRYCGISYPEDDFSGDRMKENNTRSIKGTVGMASGGKVTIRSSYGDINLD